MTWLILDLILILIVAISVLVNYRRGFLSALVCAVTVVVSLLLALYVSGRLAEPVYERYVRARLIETVDEQLAQGESETLSGLRDVIDLLTDGAQPGGQPGAAEQLVDGFLAPSALSAIRTALLILVYILCSLILRIIARALRGVNKVPLLGTLNRVCGGALGLGLGAVYALLYVSVLALIIHLSLNTLDWLNAGIIEQTRLVSRLYPHNFIAALM